MGDLLDKSQKDKCNEKQKVTKEKNVRDKPEKKTEGKDHKIKPIESRKGQYKIDQKDERKEKTSQE